MESTRSSACGTSARVCDPRSFSEICSSADSLFGHYCTPGHTLCNLEPSYDTINTVVLYFLYELVRVVNFLGSPPTFCPCHNRDMVGAAIDTILCF